MFPRSEDRGNDHGGPSASVKPSSLGLNRYSKAGEPWRAIAIQRGSGVGHLETNNRGDNRHGDRREAGSVRG